MSLYVLDTDIVTLLRRGHSRVCQNVASHPTTDLAVTVLTIEEQLSGWYTAAADGQAAAASCTGIPGTG